MLPAMKAFVKQRLLEAGFDLAGIAAAAPLDRDFTRFLEWIRKGYGADMAYLERHAALRESPRLLLPGARSVIVAAAAYEPIVPPGPIAAYAVGEDYHAVLKRALEQAVDGIRTRAPQARFRIVVDTAPLLERAWAARSGIGWIGRSTNLITRPFGPYVLLGEILTDLSLEPDGPLSNLCHDCHGCLEACPTGALVSPYQLDARLCLSYLTIEKRGAFSIAENKLLDTGPVFGCDLCLNACPHGERFREGAKVGKGLLAPPLRNLVEADDQMIEGICRSGFKKAFGVSAVMRAGKQGLLRNIEARRGKM